MKVIAFFNNKGGVGKTTLVYHLAHMLSRLGHRTVALDLDPQANLTSAFLDEDELVGLWQDGTNSTMLKAVEPILRQLGDIREVEPRPIRDRLWLVPGDLGLSRFEDSLSEAWAKVGGGGEPALRTTSAFHRIIQQAGAAVQADAALLDVGPNLGAINRAALLSTDNVVVPLAADLFSLQGLRNLGPTLRDWRRVWTSYRQVIGSSGIDLPAGIMEPAGYVVLQHATRQDRPVHAYARWLERIPEVYHKEVLGEVPPQLPANPAEDSHLLGTIKNYRSLMPMAQDARKPIFDLTAADGAIGNHYYSVQACERDFRELTKAVASGCRLPPPSRRVSA